MKCDSGGDMWYEVGAVIEELLRWNVGLSRK